MWFSRKAFFQGSAQSQKGKSRFVAVLFWTPWSLSGMWQSVSWSSMHSLLGEVVLWVRREFGWVWQGTRWQWRLGIDVRKFTAKGKSCERSWLCSHVTVHFFLKLFDASKRMWQGIPGMISLRFKSRELADEDVCFMCWSGTFAAKFFIWILICRWASARVRWVSLHWPLWGVYFPLGYAGMFWLCLTKTLLELLCLVRLSEFSDRKNIIIAIRKDLFGHWWNKWLWWQEVVETSSETSKSAQSCT